MGTTFSKLCFENVSQKNLDSTQIIFEISSDCKAKPTFFVFWMIK